MWRKVFNKDPVAQRPLHQLIVQDETSVCIIIVGAFATQVWFEVLGEISMSKSTTSCDQSLH